MPRTSLARIPEEWGGVDCGFLSVGHPKRSWHIIRSFYHLSLITDLFYSNKLYAFLVIFFVFLFIIGIAFNS